MKRKKLSGRRRSLQSNGALILLLLLLVVTACNSPGNARSNSASNGTTAGASSRSSPSPSTTKIYTGTSFHLSYPQDWLAQGSGNQIIFQDAKGVNALTVIIMPNPQGKKSAETLANSVFPPIEKAVLTNPQEAHAPSTVTVAGEVWVQKSATGTLSTGGQSGPGTLFLLLDNHPATSSTTQVYEIYYGGPTATFEQINQSVFQPMLRSFAFVE